MTHIDYGVCFDRGAALRVPELVPCRLTPMLVGGLGPTAVEGRFRVAAELTLGRMRNGRSLLLGKVAFFHHHPLSSSLYFFGLVPQMFSQKPAKDKT